MIPIEQRVEMFLALAETATPGPWETREDTDYYQGGLYIGHDPMHYVRDEHSRVNRKVSGVGADGKPEYFAVDVCRVENAADLEFLLAARNEAPLLVSYLRDMLSALERRT